MGDDAGRLALVIGGGSGIGAALVEAYRAEGTPVVTWDIAGEPDVTCDVDRPRRGRSADRRDPTSAGGCRSG